MTRPIQARDDPNSRVAPYESLLDLFTLISFILILAAFVYAARAAGSDQSWASVTAQTAEHGSGAPPTLPRDVLLMVIYQENLIDKLTVIDGTTGTSTNLIVTVGGIEFVLTSLAPSFDRSGKINIGVYEAKGPVNPGILVAMQRWLPAHGYGRYQIYFAGRP